MRDLNLKATEYFEAVARLGSVTRAADELGVSPSAVSQQIGHLEAQFGVRLFRREKRRLILTLEGDRLYQTATQAFGAIRNARSAITRQRDLRTLVIRASPSFGVRWLCPRIADFAAQNRDFAIRIDATPDFSSFETEAIDLDLRYGLGGWAGLSETGILDDMVLPLCSPAYRDELMRHSGDRAEQLAQARLIDSVKGFYRWDLWLAANRISLPSLTFPFRFDRSSMSIELAKQGGGLTLDSVNLCLPELMRGELVPFAPEFEVVSFRAYWVVCPARHLNRRIVKRFVEWLSQACAAHETQARAFLAGAGCTVRTGAGPDFFEPPPR
ncbi:LysR family transcriptional regulator [Acuticoccus sediminis]|uniref:LysR family transcriptional regulator n=1 Tax=Acuticoccus sediminis TaxID=2184697 RepID=UPI001CFE1F02|nr:LysR family transcriptional regulator [Acuticoccus sediminis]